MYFDVLMVVFRNGFLHKVKNRLLTPVVLLTLSFASIGAAGQAEKVLYYSPTEDPIYLYPLDLIKHILKKTGKKYRLEALDKPLSYARRIEELNSGGLSFSTFSTRKHLEEKLRPIRIPVFKGLLGHRIFIIRKGDQARFSRVNTFDDLLELSAGQGSLWADTKVLKDAGIPTITSSKYEGLFYMLEGGRFDYFPRAVHEPFSEIAKRKQLPLTVEEDILVVYPLALYFFVGRDNTSLAKDIEYGFETAIADGSFDEFFFNHPLIVEMLEKANLNQRKVFRLSNHHMSKETPLDREEFWFDIKKLSK